jgi:hypothetical protein
MYTYFPPSSDLVRRRPNRLNNKCRKKLRKRAAQFAPRGTSSCWKRSNTCERGAHRWALNTREISNWCSFVIKSVTSFPLCRFSITACHNSWLKGPRRYGQSAQEETDTFLFPSAGNRNDFLAIHVIYLWRVSIIQ